MPRLIDADTIFKNGVVNVWEYDGATTAQGILKQINEAPTVDAVEVVRCKDCIFFQPYEGEEHKGDCEELVGLESCVYEDDFCSYGERA